MKKFRNAKVIIADINRCSALIETTNDEQTANNSTIDVLFAKVWSLNLTVNKYAERKLIELEIRRDLINKRAEKLYSILGKLGKELGEIMKPFINN